MPTAPTYPDSPYSSTVKDKRGDLHTFRGLTYDEWHDNGSNLVGVENMEKIIGEIQDRIAAEAPTPSSAPQSTAPSSQGGWADSPPACAHGTMRAQTYKAKSGPKQGEDQYTFFCPQPKEAPASEKCVPVDGLTRKPWGSK